MKILSLVLSLLLLSTSAFAVRAPVTSRRTSSSAEMPSWKFSFFVTPEWRYERASDLDLGWVSALGFGVGLRRQSFGLTLETFDYKSSSGNSTLSIEREHRDWMVGGRYFAFDFVGASGDLGLYLAGGVGFFNETIRTTLSGVTTTDTGDREFVAIAGLGAEANLKLGATSSTELSFGIEGRILASKNFDPNPEPGLLARIGLRF